MVGLVPMVVGRLVMIPMGSELPRLKPDTPDHHPGWLLRNTNCDQVDFHNFRISQMDRHVTV